MWFSLQCTCCWCSWRLAGESCLAIGRTSMRHRLMTIKFNFNFDCTVKNQIDVPSLHHRLVLGDFPSIKRHQISDGNPMANRFQSEEKFMGHLSCLASNKDEGIYFILMYYNINALYRTSLSSSFIEPRPWSKTRTIYIRPCKAFQDKYWSMFVADVDAVWFSQGLLENLRSRFAHTKARKLIFLPQRGPNLGL